MIFNNWITTSNSVIENLHKISYATTGIFAYI